MSADGTPKLAGSRLEVADRVATLTFDRDDVRNELSGTGIYADIVKAAEWADAAEEVSVLLLTGSGRSFSAGGNVKDMDERNGIFAGDPYEIQRSYRFGIQTMTLAMHRAGLPTIAAVNGAAIGAGFDLACMCDIRIAARGAKMGETFVNLGIVPGDGGAWLLQRLVGYERAAELTLTGRVFDADEAKEMGIVSEVVEPDELGARAAALAATIAAKPPRALRLTKRLLRSAGSMDLENFLDLSASYQSHSHHNPEHRDAVGRFVEGLRKA